MSTGNEMISVIVPVYNAENYLQETIDCIFNQTYKNFELILVDDGSTDASGQICDKVAKQHRRANVYHNQNQGPARTRNFGIEKAKGTYIAFIDADDLISPDYLEQLIAGYEQDGVDLVLCGYERFASETGATISTHIIGKPATEVYESNRDLARLFTTPRTSLSGVSIWAKLYRRSIMMEKNIRFPLDVDYEEDCCFNVQYYRHVRKAFVVNRSMYRYRQSTVSLSKVYKETTFGNLVNGYNERVKFISEFDHPKNLLDGVNVVFLVVLMGNFKKIETSSMTRKQKLAAYKNVLSFQETKDVVNSCALSKVNLTRQLTLACREDDPKKVARILRNWRKKDKYVAWKTKVFGPPKAKKMKVGIITFHFPYNCGAVLQCLALQTAMEKEGNEVEVINYRPWYHQNRYVPFRNPIYYAHKRAMKRDANDRLKWQLMRGAKGFVQTVHSWVNFKKVMPKHKRFKRFIKTNLHETRIYRTIKQLRRRSPKCGLYISGSDQLWNAKLTEGVLDPAYLLDFGKPETGRVTFSVGVDLKGLIRPADTYKSQLAKLNAISTREKNGYDQVEKLAGKNTYLHVDVDPTFLLDKEEYEPFICKTELEKEPFILTYTMPNDTQPKVNNAAKLLGEKLGIKVIDVSGDPTAGNKKVADNRICGPDEFLWYVKHASYVFTNSFHGTAFSVIFEKQFMSIPHTITGYRVMELLEKMGLKNRYVDNGVAASKRIEQVIDYAPVRENRRKLKKISIDYLKMCVDKYGNKM